jgi:hypothetical protein
MNERQTQFDGPAWDGPTNVGSFITLVSARQEPSYPSPRVPSVMAASVGRAFIGYGSGMTTTPQDPDTVEPDVVPSLDPDPISTPGENPDLPDTEPQPIVP